MKKMRQVGRQTPHPSAERVKKKLRSAFRALLVIKKNVVTTTVMTLCYVLAIWYCHRCLVSSYFETSFISLAAYAIWNDSKSNNLASLDWSCLLFPTEGRPALQDAQLRRCWNLSFGFHFLWTSCKCEVEKIEVDTSSSKCRVSRQRI